MDTKKTIAELLLQREAVKVKMDPPFTWTSGIKSPIYCDNRKIISYPMERRVVIEAMKQVIEERKLNPEAIAGTATAAIPWAAFLAADMDLPMVYVRPEPKKHGGGKQVEGELESGKRVLVVEDLISTGGSSIATAKAVKKECAGVVTNVLAIVTYGFEESKQAFQDAGLQLFTLTDFSTIVAMAVDREVISKAHWDAVLQFAKNPRDWAKNVGL